MESIIINNFEMNSYQNHSQKAMFLSHKLDYQKSLFSIPPSMGYVHLHYNNYSKAPNYLKFKLFVA